jgi:hypothetical protein
MSRLIELPTRDGDMEADCLVHSVAGNSYQSAASTPGACLLPERVSPARAAGSSPKTAAGSMGGPEAASAPGINPNAQPRSMEAKSQNRTVPGEGPMERRNQNTAENGSPNIAALVLVMLAALALLCFVLAGLRIREIRAGATAEPSVMSPLLRALAGANPLA